MYIFAIQININTHTTTMKHLILFSAILFSSIFTFAQSLELLHNNTTITNGDTIVMTSVDNSVTYVLSIWFTNASSQKVNVRVRKTELSVVAGSDNYFCNWASCYQPIVFESPDSLPMMPADTFKQFTGDYGSNGNPGATYVMYTFYNDSDHTDSVSVVAKYVAGSGVGISQSQSNIYVSNAYPNPVSSILYLDYAFDNSQSASIEIYNVVGSLVSKQEIQGTAGKAKINTASLNNGVYFYNVIVDGVRITSKKFIVQH